MHSNIQNNLTQAIAEIIRLRGELAELHAEQHWQPIATAPRDGAEILVWRYEDDLSRVARWVRGLKPFSGRWVIGRMDNHLLEFEGPTHWRALPSSPLAMP